MLNYIKKKILKLFVSIQKILDKIFGKSFDNSEGFDIEIFEEDLLGSLDKILKVEDQTEEEKKSKAHFNHKLIDEFMGEFVGVAITDIKAYIDIGFEPKEVVGSIVTDVLVDSSGANLVLSTLDGKPNGKLFLEFGVSGQIIEKSIEELPANTSLYRIEFFGGDSIEYSDENQKNILLYRSN